MGKLPNDEGMKCTDTDHEAYITATPLRSLELKCTQWEQLTSFQSVVEKPEECIGFGVLSRLVFGDSGGIVHHSHHNPIRPAKRGSSGAYFPLVPGVSHVRR